jgi:O-antigen ligase
MAMQEGAVIPVRQVIVGTIVVCLAIVIAPWFSGGQEPIATWIDAGVLLLSTLLIWRQPQIRVLRWGPLVFTYAALIGLALLSLLWSVNRFSTAEWIVEWVIAGLAFRLAYVLAGEKNGRDWLVNAYLLSALVFCLGAIWLYLTTPYDRLTGTIYWPNPAAAYLIPAVLLSLDRARVAARRRVMLLWAIAVVTVAASFVLTASRGASIVLAFVLVLYCLLVETKRHFWIRFVSVIVLSLGVAYGLVLLSTFTVQHSENIAPGSRLAQIASRESESLTDRLYYAESALEIWFANPVGGTGAGTYGDVHPQYQKRVISASTDAHDLYVQTLAEQGIFGGIVMAALILWLLAGTIRGIVDDHSLVAIGLGGVGLLIHFGVDIDASYPAILALAAACFGLVYRQWVSTRRSASWRLPAVAALLLVPTANVYLGQSWATKALASQNSGDYALAATQFESAHRGVVFDPEYVDAEGIDYYTIATAGGSESAGASALALNRALEAERLAPRDGQNYQLEGRVLTLEGKLPQAEAAFHHALALDPYDQPGYSLDLASAQLLAGNLGGALKTAQVMLAKYPDSVITNRQLDTTLRPTLGDLAALAGNIYLQQSNLKAAAKAGQLSLHIDPGNLRGRALMHQVQKRQA